MSDDFDREAEREKLREQFGEDEEDREHSERLSELLLKGATMTNKHCNQCGDPVFRHEGREFCPSCQREVADEETRTATAGRAATGGLNPSPDADGHDDGVEVDVETPDAGEPTTDDAGDAPTDDTAGATAGMDVDTTTQPDAGGTGSTGDAAATGGPEQAPQSGAGQAGGAQPSAAGQGARGDSPAPAAGSQGGAGGQEQRTRTPVQTGSSGGAADGLMPARQHLTRTVNRLAEQAAAEEDPGRKREFLAATREAAEALAAVRDAE